MTSQKKILITGASGFIGSHLLKHLAGKKSFQTAGLVRKTSNLFRLQGKEYHLLHASLDEPLENIVHGFDIVIHTAALARDWGNYNNFYRTNVEGTVNIVKASIHCGVKRFIHFSSVVVYGFKGNVNTDETKKMKPFSNNYCITKSLTEEKIMRFKDEIELFILRPSNVFGPFDTSFTYPLYSALEKGLAGWTAGGKTLTSPCYIKNLVQAAGLCLKAPGGAGEAYNITDGKDILWKEYLKMTADELQKKPPFLPVPAALLYRASLILEKGFQLFHSQKPPLITPYRIAQSMRDFSFSIDKAKRLLGYSPSYTTLEGTKESIEWYYKYRNALASEK